MNEQVCIMFPVKWTVIIQYPKILSLNTDVVYDPEIVSCLVRLLEKLIKIPKKAPEVYISSTIRNPGTYTSFKEELGEFNVSIFFPFHNT